MIHTILSIYLDRNYTYIPFKNNKSNMIFSASIIMIE